MLGGFWRNLVTIGVIAWHSPVHQGPSAPRLEALPEAAAQWLDMAPMREALRPAAEAAAVAAARKALGLDDGEPAGSSAALSPQARKELARLAALAARMD
jgi:hypothetical protein